MRKSNTIIIDCQIELKGDTLNLSNYRRIEFKPEGEIRNGVIVINGGEFINPNLNNITFSGIARKIDGCWFSHSDTMSANEFQLFINSVSETKSQGYFSERICVDITKVISIKSHTYIDFNNCTLYKKGGTLQNEGYISGKYDTENICLKNITYLNKGRQRVTGFSFIGVNKLRIENLNYFDDSEADLSDKKGDWCMRLQGINIKLNKISINNYRSGIWADGIHIERVKDFSIEHFNIKSGDDCIAIHNNMNDSLHGIQFDENGYCGFIPRTTSNIVIKNGELQSYMANLIRLGAESYIDEHFFISDVTITKVRAKSGMCNKGIQFVDLRENSTSPCHNLYFCDIKMDFNTSALIIGIDGRNPKGVTNVRFCNIEGKNESRISPAKQLTNGVLLNYVNNVQFKLCKLTSSQDFGMRIFNSKDVSFNNCIISLIGNKNAPYISRSNMIVFENGSFLSDFSLGVRDSSTLVLRGVRGLKNVNISNNSKILNN